MTDKERRTKAKKQMAGRIVEDLAEKMNYNEEQKEALKLGIYAGVKMSVKLDVFGIGMKALQKEYEQVEEEVLE